MLPSKRHACHQPCVDSTIVCKAWLRRAPSLLQPGVHRRAFLVVNDHCSAKGTAWRARQCILMAPVLTVPSRGSCLPRVERRLQRGSWLQRLCRRMGLGWPGGSSKYRSVGS